MAATLNTFLKRKRTTETGEKWQKARALRLHDSGLLTLLIYTLVSAQVFYFFQCAEVVSTANTTATTTATTTTKTTDYLIADYSVKCYDSAWLGMLPFVLIVFCGFSLGVPLGIALVMRRRKDLLEDTHVKEMWGMLYKPVRM